MERMKCILYDYSYGVEFIKFHNETWLCSGSGASRSSKIGPLEKQVFISWRVWLHMQAQRKIVCTVCFS